MLPIQVLWINMVAAVALTLPFGFEAKEPDLMQRSPRPLGTPLLNRFIVTRTITVSCLMAVVALLLFWSSNGNQTLVVTSVVWFQVFYLLSCRTLRTSSLRIGLWSNPSVYLGIAVTLLLQIAYVQLPWMQHLFSSQPLDLFSWVKASVSGALIGLFVTLEKKFLFRQLGARR
jgi:Ca2+-transporting ATPase